MGQSNSYPAVKDIMMDHTREVVTATVEELIKATSMHGPMVSAHEGWAVILEEVDELWEEVREKHKNKERMREEAIQIAAMAMRFVIDICGEEKEVVQK